jgi:hypothetical protein
LRTAYVLLTKHGKILPSLQNPARGAKPKILPQNQKFALNQTFLYCCNNKTYVKSAQEKKFFVDFKITFENFCRSENAEFVTILSVKCRKRFA